MLAHSLRVQSLMARKLWQAEAKAAAHSANLYSEGKRVKRSWSSSYFLFRLEPQLRDSVLARG